MLVNPIPVGILDVFKLYDQYKILGFTVRLFPANVGTEPGTGVVGPPVFNRGDQCWWTDQRFDSTALQPLFISEVINNASTRMMNPRRFQRRSIWRATGNPEWGSCIDYTTDPDDWDGSIEFLGNNATPDYPLYYYTIQWKVIVRGRRQN